MTKRRTKTSSATVVVAPAVKAVPNIVVDFRYDESEGLLYWRRNTETSMNTGTYELQWSRAGAIYTTIATINNIDFSTAFEVYYEHSTGQVGDKYRIRSISSDSQPTWAWTNMTYRIDTSMYYIVKVALRDLDYFRTDKVKRTYFRLVATNTVSSVELEYYNDKANNQLYNLVDSLQIRLDPRSGSGMLRIPKVVVDDANVVITSKLVGDNGFELNSSAITFGGDSVVYLTDLI